MNKLKISVVPGPTGMTVTMARCQCVGITGAHPRFHFSAYWREPIRGEPASRNARVRRVFAHQGLGSPELGVATRGNILSAEQPIIFRYTNRAGSTKTTPMKNFVRLLIACSLLASSASAEDPARAFLDGLRDRGYHDVAMAYLDQLESSRLAPDDLKSTILYEKSLLLIDGSRKQRDPQVRARQLNQAQSWLEQFIQSQAAHPKVNAARSLLGTLIVERARLLYEEAETANDAKLKAESLALYDQSFEVFSELQTAVRERLDKIPKVLDTRDRKEMQLIATRKQLRADYLQTEMFAAAIREELADILPPGSPDQIKCLEDAAQMYDGIYKDYRTLLAGRYARLYQGRCYQRLGRTKEALGYFGELLDQSNDPETLMMLKAKALVMALETWLSPAEMKYMEAIKQARRWFDETPGDKHREAEWIAIRFHLARALKAQADDAKTDPQVDRALVAQSLEAARKELQFVAAETGELQEPAQQLLTQLGGPNVREQEQEPETFMAAQAVAKEAMDALGPAATRIASLHAELAAADSDQQKATLNDRLAAETEMRKEAEEKAIHYYRLALQLADDQTPQSNIGLVQYFLSYVYFARGDFYDAAVVADFVAQRYPNSPGARQCAKIAVGCYLKLLQQSTDSHADFEIRRLCAIGSYISETWPDDPITPETLGTLIPHLINSGAALQAAEFVRKLPEQSAVRGELELITGQAIWGEFRSLQRERLLAEPSSDAGAEVSEVSDTGRLTELKNEAKSLLMAGYDRLPDDPVVDQASATALLSLSQIFVEDQQYAEAIEVLEHPALGPMTLLEAGSSPTSNPLFAEETYSTALRAYVASLGDGSPETMDKAKKTIASMQQAVGDDDAGTQRMLGVYVNLAQDVQRRMESASPQTRQELSAVFEAFLSQLGGIATDVAVLHWVADTFAKLAEGFDDSANPNAQMYYRRAEESFQKVLSQPAVSPDLINQVNVRLAGIKHQLADFDAALQLYEYVLKRDPNAINVQVAAARFLQAWGVQDTSRLEQAVYGTGDALWGWAKIATSTAQYEQFRGTFYEARYEMAKCQVALAEVSSGKDNQRLLSSARRGLIQTSTLYPKMDQWKAKYDALIDSIKPSN